MESNVKMENMSISIKQIKDKEGIMEININPVKRTVFHDKLTKEKMWRGIFLENLQFKRNCLSSLRPQSFNTLQLNQKKKEN